MRAFECLGACDIAPMASVDGVYVGPLTLEDVPALLDDVRAGRPVLPEKQLARKRVADPLRQHAGVSAARPRGRRVTMAEASATIERGADPPVQATSTSPG